MKVKGEGFTSKLGKQEAEAILNHHRFTLNELKAIIDACHTFVMSANITGQDTDKEKQKIISLILGVRLLEISGAALLVIESGMSNEANTLFRVFLDAYFVFANVCTNPEFITGYFKSDEAMRLKLMNSSKKHNSELFKKINTYADEQLKTELKQKITEEKIQTFNSYAYAENVGCSEIYDCMYRLMSASLHTTPRSLQKYMKKDKHGNIIEIKYHPTEDDIPQRIYDFAYFLIKILSGLKEIFGELNAEEIEAMTRRLEQSVIR
ncbi:MAG: hypothetical protein D3915_03755 [Candidatus Electrothrix sp. AU1_5]|nr:hypothetical protein [Candidatus Electrothrix sp. AX1]MCI5182481.1 hypothetical protein [Candidatus Electrothrix gigas]MCI5192231.1 hypothetical protein [Candidatus Electrothrix gigas]